MACKLTYKGIRFDSEQDLFNFLQIETQSNLSDLLVQRKENLINSYQIILENGIELVKLYEDESIIKNKIDSCPR